MDAPSTWRSNWHADPPEQTPAVPVVHVADRDEPEVVGTIHGPDGKPLHTVTRATRPFGYTR